MSPAKPKVERPADEIRRLRARLKQLLAESGQAQTGFIRGGGEMGELIRRFDWASTSVGVPSRWPQSLKTSLETMLHSRYAMFVWWGPEFINFYNDAYIPMLGNRHPWALGQMASEVWPDVWDAVGGQARAVLHEGKATWNQELLLVMRRFGYTEETYFTFSYSPVFDDEGHVGGVFCAVTEDTERVLSERRMRCLRQIAVQTVNARTASEACQSSAAVMGEHSKDISFALVYLLNQDGSASLAGATGLPAGTPFSPESIPGGAEAQWPVRDVVGGRSSVLRDVEALGLPGGAWTESTSTVAVLPLCKGAQGRPRGFLVAGASPLREFDGKYREFFELLAGGVAGAIANAEAYEEEKRRAEALAELDHAKTAFFSNVSHEFRTPLTLLLGPLEELLAKKGQGLEAADWSQIELIHRNGLRLLRLVNTLLDFSRLEAGRAQAAYAPTDLAALTGNLASVFRSAVERAGMQLTIDCPPLPEPVYVDRDMWEKIVLNLLSNAFKYTFEGRIEVSLRAAEGNVVLRISDTGTGIPVDQLSRIFERFQRVEGARGRTHEGTGIGLALVQELVRLHGGTVMVDSELGKGSTFAVEIPLGSEHLPADRIGTAPPCYPVTPIHPEAYFAEASQWLREEEEPPAPAGLKSPGRILLADDNADMRAYLHRLLGERYTVEMVADGEAALAAILRDPPDLLLTDVMMPGMSGLDLLQKIRENPRTRTLPVIVLSARAGEESRVEGLECGADDYLVKPFTAREVLARVAAHLEIGRVRRDSEVRFRQLYASNVIGVVSGDEEHILEANDAFLKMLGQHREDLDAGHLSWAAITPPEYREADERAMAELFATGISKQFESELIRKDGGRIPVLVGATILDRSPLRRLCFVIDLTERKELQRRLFEKQKLESIGLLAGGIAHDFNNLLVGVMGNASLIQELVPAGSTIRELVDDVARASDRAAHLTRQILAYSGQGRFHVQTVDLSELVKSMAELMQPSIPKKVRVHFELEDNLPPVEADAGQMQQVVMNLVVNAAEAIGETPGEIYIRTGIHKLNRHDVRHEFGHTEIDPGTYVSIEVRDTGCGMDETTMSRMFDPFYTTKFMGRGLGLAAASGIVRGHKGAIQVSSVPGEGTTLLVLLPAVGMPQQSTDGPHAPTEEEPKSADTVLLVDDEELVLRTARKALERHGYRVLEAASGVAAIEILNQDKARVSVVLLDLSMPEMGGNETLPRLRAVKPDLHVIVSSGYSEAETMRFFAGQAISGFLQKPYTSLRLAEKVREAIGGR